MAIDITNIGEIEEISYRNQRGEIVTIDPKKLLGFNRNNLPFESQANTYFLVARLAELAKLKVENLKVDQRKLQGELYAKYANDDGLKATNNGRKPTEGTISHMIDSDESMVELSKKLNNNNYKAQLLNRLVKAFEQRKDLMQSLSAQMRQENSFGVPSNPDKQ